MISVDALKSIRINVEDTIDSNLSGDIIYLICNRFSDYIDNIIWYSIEQTVRKILK
jgi:hypothetical protein